MIVFSSTEGEQNAPRTPITEKVPARACAIEPVDLLSVQTFERLVQTIESRVESLVSTRDEQLDNHVPKRSGARARRGSGHARGPRSHVNQRSGCASDAEQPKGTRCSV